MRYYVLLLLVTAGAFAVTAFACAAIVASLWPAVRKRLPLAASARARQLAMLRLAPVIGGAVALAAVAVTFLRYEPGNTTENPGGLLLLSAAASLALATAAAMRWHAAARRARQCHRLLRACGSPQTHPDGYQLWIVDTQYPVAGVMGVLRTRLLLSRRILAECTDAEVASVVRHELAHLRRRDNLVQAAMRFLPDPLAHTRTGRTLQSAWSLAAEEAADDLAAHGASERTDLAAALVRVAGMAEGRPPQWMPALTFFERNTVESRVRRLLLPGPAAQGSLRALPAAIVIIAAAALIGTEAVGLRLHALMELAVQVLP